VLAGGKPGKRLARVMMIEAVRRLQARGLREARVGTAHFNASAIAAYLAAGFTLVDRSFLWTKTNTPEEVTTDA
jgi:ribosomal protein S18 acetylase RimI-like enzyme